MLHHNSDSEYGDMSWLQVIKEENSLWRQEHVQPFMESWQNYLRIHTNKWYKMPDGGRQMPGSTFQWMNNLRYPRFNTQGNFSKAFATITKGSTVASDFISYLDAAFGRLIFLDGANVSWADLHYQIDTNYYNQVISKLNSWDTFYNIYTNQYLQSFLTRPGLNYVDTTNYAPFYLWYPTGERTVVPTYNESKTLQGLLSTLMDYIPLVLSGINVGVSKIYDDLHSYVSDARQLLTQIANQSATNSVNVSITNIVNGSDFQFDYAHFDGLFQQYLGSSKSSFDVLSSWLGNYVAVPDFSLPPLFTLTACLITQIPSNYLRLLLQVIIYKIPCYIISVCIRS